MREILIQGVRVVTGGTVSEPQDVRVAGGRILEVVPAAGEAGGQTSGAGVGSSAADTEWLDGRGAYLSAGWIDLHAHIYPGVSEIGLDPDRIGLCRGVHVVVDAGSAGSTTLGGFRDYVAARSRTAVRALLNISAMGLVVVKGATELPDLRWVHLDETIAVARANPGLIRGIKVRASGLTTGHLGLEPLKLAKQAARELGLPLMVHIGEVPPELPEVLDLLDKGDLVTHCFHGKPGGIFGENGELIPALLSAVERGVWLDVGHGAASCSLAVTRKAIAMGMRPHTISTDLHVRSIGPVQDLGTTMTKLLACGLPLPEVIAAVTERPAQWLQEPGFRSVAPGEPAHLTLFRLETSPLELRDATGASETVHSWFQPLFVITPDGAVKCE